MLGIDESVDILRANGIYCQRLVRQNRYFVGKRVVYTLGLITAAQKIQDVLCEILENN